MEIGKDNNYLELTHKFALNENLTCLVKLVKRRVKFDANERHVYSKIQFRQLKAGKLASS